MAHIGNLSSEETIHCTTGTTSTRCIPQREYIGLPHAGQSFGLRTIQ
jgi:hypothetical protein